MQHSGNEILHADRPSDVVDGLQPFQTSTEANCEGMVIESYRLPKFGPAPKFCYSSRHVVSLQRTGVVSARKNGSSKIWRTGAIAICPIGAPQPSFSFSNFIATNVILDPAFLRHAVSDEIDADGLEIVPLHLEREEQLGRLILSADFEVRSGFPGGQLLLESLGTAMAAHLLTQHATKRVARENSCTMPKYLLRRAIDFIHENLGKNLSLAEISATVDMSPYHFCRSFKRGTGLSPYRYVRRERIRRAQQYLAEHRLSLVEIANELGFSDQSHFTRTFHSMVGVTPSRYSADK